MIAVIADDFTGAAEIAGLGWRHGLTAEILHRDEPPTNADLVVYDSDSRNCSSAEARRQVTRILKRLQRRKPSWLFKKVDSVLRGNVLAEIEAALRTLRLSRCILVPANPAAGRVIRHGKYFIRGKPIHRTDFRNDPRHPRLSSKVTDLLGAPRSFALTILSPQATALADGIVVGEVATVRDVRRWSRRVDERTLPAGGGDFFRALLLEHGLKLRVSQARWSHKQKGTRNLFRFDATRADAGKRNEFRAPATRTLFVSGSLAKSSAEFLRSCRSKGWPVLLMPDELFRVNKRARIYRAEWVRNIVEALERHPKVVVSIGRPALGGRRTPLRLGRILTDTVKRVLSAAWPDRVCVEGGATAALFVQTMGWTRFRVEREFSTGVTGARPHSRRDLLVVLKPGSYVWPPALSE